MTTATIFYRKGLIGGGSDDLDAIPVATPANNDLALTIDSNKIYAHKFDSSATNAESSPDYIRPDDYSTAGVWVLQDSPFDVTTGVETGDIRMWPTETVQSGYLECNGAAVSRTTYSALFAVVGEIYGEGDGATTFNLPDFRGKFLRGWDHGAGTDPDAASRTDSGDLYATGDHIGTNQADAFDEHNHSFPTYSTSGGTSRVCTGGSGTQGTKTSTSAGGSETRPVNINVMYVIKY